jgi:hypothetical protein
MGDSVDATRGELAGQVAIVTGGGREIGRAIAVALADAGAAVAVAARSADELDATAAAIQARGGRSVAVPTDVTDADVVSPEALEQADVTGFKRELASLEAALGKPLAMKGMFLNWNIAFLDTMFDKVLFVHVAREPAYVVQSLLDGRPGVRDGRGVQGSVPFRGGEPHTGSAGTLTEDPTGALRHPAEGRFGSAYMKRVVIIGAGGFGREVLDIFDTCNQVRTAYNVLNFLVQSEYAKPGEVVHGKPVLGDFDWPDRERRARQRDRCRSRRKSDQDALRRLAG